MDHNHGYRTVDLPNVFLPVSRHFKRLLAEFGTEGCALLDSVDAVIQFAKTMTWKGNHPLVELVTTTYRTGVKLTKEAMQVVETSLQRWPSLEKWFVDITYSLPVGRDN